MGGWYLLVLFVLLVGMTCGWALPSWCGGGGTADHHTAGVGAAGTGGLAPNAAGRDAADGRAQCVAHSRPFVCGQLIALFGGVLWHCIMGQRVWHWVYAAWDAAGTWLWGLVFGLCDAGLTKLPIFTKLCIFSCARWTDSGLCQYVAGRKSIAVLPPISMVLSRYSGGSYDRMYYIPLAAKGDLRMDLLKGTVMNGKKCICIVLDSVGIGALPDAGRSGDEGSHTLLHVMQAGYSLSNLCAMGLANIDGCGLPGKVESPKGCYGKAAERFQGKDTTGGHWEIAGLVLDRPFPTFPQGFPKPCIQEFEKRIGRHVIGNRAESGTKIIQELGDEHVCTGFPIVYTSADSVFQIAAHEEVIPVETLYEICREARRLLDGPWRVGRVIARPFTGHSGAYVRTKRRKDFSVQPPGNTMLDVLQKAGLETMGIGKIEDIFAQRGLSRIEHTTDNASGIQATLRAMQQPFQGLVFTNLVDFDMLYGHRNDVKGYGEALTVFDNALPELIAALGPEDLFDRHSRPWV